jgi:putative CocE/NonD family hydrolase
MSLFSRLLARLFRLPPAETHDLIVQRDLAIAMPDGVTLLADRYAPRQGERRPLILLRSPYGRAGLLGTVYGRLFAERGFQVLIQSCRGTADSGGVLDPFRQERADGLATLAWIRQQPWYGGRLATNGPSYLGLVQWAVAADAPELQAIAAQITSPDFRRVTYDGEAFSLDNSLGWTALVTGQAASGPRFSTAAAERRRVEAAFAQLPLSAADIAATGRRVQFWQDWLRHNAPGDPWWQPQDFWGALPQVTAPAHLLGGWQDIFLPDTIGQYEALRGAGRAPALVIGPWTHSDYRAQIAAVRESLAWFRAHLLGETWLLRRRPVRLWLQGADEWRDYDAWPPPGYGPQRWHLQASQGLAPEPSGHSPPDCYSYDPGDPTPACGGAVLGPNSGRRDQRALEARPDVLTYTSTPLAADLELIGAVRAELWVRSSLAHTDFFVSLCDVDASGLSLNVCDGLRRLTPGVPAPAPDGSLPVVIALQPTAYRFKRGHRLRVQVSSGAHPRWARNPGSAEPLGAATTLIVASQAVLHDHEHPSAVILPARI